MIILITRPGTQKNPAAIHYRIYLLTYRKSLGLITKFFKCADQVLRNHFGASSLNIMSFDKMGEHAKAEEVKELLLLIADGADLGV